MFAYTTKKYLVVCMITIIGNMLVNIFGNNSWLATIIISMFPIVELKGAIPVGMSVDFWGANALSEKLSLVFSLIGSCLVVPVLALIFKPVIRWMLGTKIFKKIASRIEDKVKKSSTKIENKLRDGGKESKKNTVLKMIGVFSFVAIPFPLTGVWTGTAIAVCVGLKFWQIVVACVLGNVVAGLLIMFVCSAFPQFTSILFLIVLAIVLVILLTTIIKILATKKVKEE